MNSQTNIRIDKDQAKRSKKIREKTKGAQIGEISFKNRKPTHTEIYSAGLDFFEAELKRK